MFITINETIIHPETRDIILEAGETYTIEYIMAVAEDYGIDTIDGIVHA